MTPLNFSRLRTDLVDFWLISLRRPPGLCRGTSLAVWILLPDNISKIYAKIEKPDETCRIRQRRCL